MKDVKEGREGTEALKDIFLASYMYAPLHICLWVYSRDFDFFQFFSLNINLCWDSSLQGLGYCPVTQTHSPDHVSGLWDRQLHHLPGSPLWKKVAWPCKLKPLKDPAVQFSLAGDENGLLSVALRRIAGTGWTKSCVGSLLGCLHRQCPFVSSQSLLRSEARNESEKTQSWMNEH